MENSISLYRDILAKNKKIVIPEYQREYSWDKEDLEIFLEDIQKAIESNSIFYLGTIYTYEPEGKNEIHIIDGQQRITTLIIYLYVILEKIKKEEAKFIYLEDGMNKIYSDNEALQNAYSYSFYEEFDSFEEETKNSQIETNIKVVESMLKNMNTFEIENIYSVLKEQVRINVVCVTDLKSAMNIFMNLNARGKELSAIEIIKSNIFSYILDLDTNEYFLKELKNKFNKLIYKTDSPKYNDNINLFKKNLYLYLCYKDIDLVIKYKLKENTNDKVFSSIFMKIILKNYDFTSVSDMNDFINELETFTNIYIWWNIKRTRNYNPTMVEEKYRQKYNDINKAKTTDIATLISFSDIDNNLELGYKRVLEAFSIIELKKVYNKYILQMEDSKISLSPIEKDMPKIIKALKADSIASFVSVFDTEEYTFPKSKDKELRKELMAYFKANGIDENKKEIEIIKHAMANIKGSGMLK